MTRALEADLAAAPIVNAVPQIVVAVPPSSIDGALYRMRIEVAGFALVTRAFDPELEQP